VGGVTAPTYVGSDQSAEPIDNYMALRGFSRLRLDRLGMGAPDRLYGGHRLLLLVELKTGDRKRTPKQLKWAQLWRGPEVYVWRTPEDAQKALRVLGLT